MANTPDRKIIFELTTNDDSINPEALRLIFGEGSAHGTIRIIADSANPEQGKLLELTNPHATYDWIHLMAEECLPVLHLQDQSLGLMRSYLLMNSKLFFGNDSGMRLAVIRLLEANEKKRVGPFHKDMKLLAQTFEPPLEYSSRSFGDDTFTLLKEAVKLRVHGRSQQAE